jgi:hypothetical protein
MNFIANNQHRRCCPAARDIPDDAGDGAREHRVHPIAAPSTLLAGELPGSRTVRS